MKLALGLLFATTTIFNAQTPQNHRSLANGVYAVVRETPTRETPKRGDVSRITLVYDQHYSEADRNDPPNYVTLDTSSFVPLRLAGPPTTAKADTGWTLLNLTLSPEHVKTLEDFTRTHVGGRVAIVIDREIITMHKVRSVITGGQVQITRCQDDACQVLRRKLTE